MTDYEIRGNAIISELTKQRNSALDRCALMAAELAQAQAKIKELEPQKDKPELKSV